MKVRMLTSVQGPALRCKYGEIVDIDEAMAQRYIAKGQAESVATKAAKPETAAVDPVREKAVKKTAKPRAKPHGS